jgi:carbon-monoxide dehydrogenase small subunit
MTPVSLTVNGRAVQALVEPRTHLADFLREHLHLTGTHLGCEQGVCGACTVVLDGKPQRSCIAYALDCDGSTVTTIEGFDDDALMEDLRTAFSAHHGLQCGFCTPGMLVTARDIVARLGDVPEARIREELSGNLCRCTGYVGIVAAIRAVCDGRQKQVVATPDSAAGAGSVAQRLSLPASGIRSNATPAETAPPSPPMPAADGRPVLTERLSLAASPDMVWAALADLHAVAACLPGAEITAIEGEAITGRLRIALGPIRAAFAGQGSVTRDEATRSGRLSGRGRDTGTGSSVEGQANYAIHPSGAGTTLEVTLSWRLTGSLAQFARTELVQALARQVLRQFTANLEAMISGRAPTEAKPLGLLGLLWALIRARLFRR